MYSRIGHVQSAMTTENTMLRYAYLHVQFSVIYHVYYICGPAPL